MSDSEPEHDPNELQENEEQIGPIVVVDNLDEFRVILPPSPNDNDNNEPNVNDLNLNVVNANENEDNESDISDGGDPNENVQNDYMSDGDGNDSDVWDNASSGHENVSGAEDEQNSDAGGDDDNSPRFDLQLPMRHQYLGDGMEELQGRILLDEGSILEVPIALMSFHLVPGQTLPLTVYHPVFQNALRRCVLNNRNFGIVNTGLELETSDGRRTVQRNAIGTLAEIYEFQEDSDHFHNNAENNNQAPAVSFAIKAKGRQRFNVLEVRRQADGNLMGKIRIRPEITLGPSLDNNYLTGKMRYIFPDLTNHIKIGPNFKGADSSADVGDNVPVDLQFKIAEYEKSFNALVSRNAAKRKSTRYKSGFTPWPAFLYDLYDEDLLVEKIHRKLQTELKGLMESGSKTNIPLDGPELGFWLAMNLTMEDNIRLEILKLDCPIQRLRYELNFLEKVSPSICCRHCSRTIADQKDIFSMSIEGPQGTFVNPNGYVHETITVHQVTNISPRGIPSTEASWFPGYAWTIIECRFCRTHLGWKFKATGRLQPKKFWGLSRQSVTMKYSKRLSDFEGPMPGAIVQGSAAYRQRAQVANSRGRVLPPEREIPEVEYNRHAIVLPPLPEPEEESSDDDELFH